MMILYKKVLKCISNFLQKPKRVHFRPIYFFLKRQPWRVLYFFQQQCFNWSFQKIVLFITIILSLVTNKMVLASLNDGLVAYYPFDGNAQDASGNNYHGTEQGGTSYTSGKIGQGMNFNGVDAMMSATLPEVKRTYSISLFAKFNHNQVENQLFYLTRSGYSDRVGYLSTWPPNERSWHFGSRRYGQGWEDRSAVEKDVKGLLDNVWHHLVFILNDNQISLYVNGELLKIVYSAYSSDVEQQKNLLLLIGGTTEVEHQTMNGIIDEVRFYNRLLSKPEIQSLYTGKGICPTLSLSKNGTGQGKIIAPTDMDCGADGTKEYYPGTLITLSIIPNSNSSFVGWTGTGCANSFTITTDMNCTATFDLLPVKLTVKKVGSGTGTIKSTLGLTEGINCGKVCEENYSPGSPITFTVTPDAHSSFVGWVETNCSESFIITQNITCTTIFKQKVVTPSLSNSPPILSHISTLGITLEGTGEGTITSQDKKIHCTKTGKQCQATYPTGTTVTLTPIAAPGSYFSSWGGGEDCADGRVQLLGSQFCVAYFHKLSELTVEKVGEGTVIGKGINCGKDCTESYPSMTPVTLTATPDQGFTFEGWNETCGGDNPTITVMMDMTKTCQATFSSPLVLPTVEMGSVPLKLSSHRQTKKLRFMAPEENFSSSVLQKNASKLRIKPLASGAVSISNPDLISPMAIQQPSGLSSTASPEEAARHFLTYEGEGFGINETTQLQRMIVQVLPRGRSVVRFQQAHQDIPILGGEIIVNMDAKKNVMSVNGEISPQLQDLSTEPTLSVSQAEQIASAKVARDYQVNVSQLTTSKPELWIYDPAILGTPGPQITALVWRVEVTSQSKSLSPIHEVVLVEAHLGIVVFSYSEIKHAKINIHNQNNSYTYDPDTSSHVIEGTVSCGNESCTGTPHCNDSGEACKAFDYLKDTYTFYFTQYKRRGIKCSNEENNCQETPIEAIINYVDEVYCAVPCQNSFWDGSQMLFGQNYVTDDLVGHEFTHGVTQYTSNLFYFYQSGAINESFSDLWGEFIDQENHQENEDDSIKWKIGEDRLNVGATRDMAHPENFGHPNKMTSEYYKCEQTTISGRWPDDAGGVHTNNSINNKAVYLMTDGGTFNGKTVKSLGLDKVAQLYYEVQTHLLTSAADYADLYDALLQACTNLTLQDAEKFNGTDCEQMRNALDAVEMYRQPSQCLTDKTSLYETSLCEGEQVVDRDIFFDDFEFGNGHWITGGNPNGNVVDLMENGVPVSAWSVPQSIAPSSIKISTGQYATSGSDSDPPGNNAWGLDQGNPVFGGKSDTFLTMKDPKLLPPNAFMHFKHAYGFDSKEIQFFDGGVLEYTTDGTTWSDVGNLGTTILNGYNGTLTSPNNPSPTDNPLKSRKAFVADSLGYISSRVDLSPLAGQSVRFRFRIGTDQTFSDYGWFIDDVRIYSCQVITNVCNGPDVVKSRGGVVSWNDPNSWENGQPGPDKIVKIESGSTVKNLPQEILVKGLCNEGTLSTNQPLTIKVKKETGFIYNSGQIISVKGKSSSEKSNLASASFDNVGDHGQSIKLDAGGLFYNTGTIQAGDGGAGYLRGGKGGSVEVYARRIVNTNTGQINAGNGGEGNAHQPAVDRSGSWEWDPVWDNYIIPYGNKPVSGGNGGKLILQAKESLSNHGPVLSGKGGNAYVWCVNGVSLINWGSDGRWYTGDCSGATTPASSTGGKGGDLIQLSPTLYSSSPASSGSGLYYEPHVITMDAKTHLEAKENIVIFGGHDWVLDLKNLSPGAISTPRDITLAVGTGSTIDLRGNASKIFQAGGTFTVFTDILLLDEGVSLNDLVEAPGGIITHPSKILRLVVLNGPEQVAGEPQTTLPIELELLNGGPEADFYTLTIRDVAGWNFSSLPSQISVEGLGRKTLKLNLTLPVTRGESDTITITATSLADPMASAKADIQVRVNPSPPELVSTFPSTPDISPEKTDHDASDQVDATPVVPAERKERGAENPAPEVIAIEGQNQQVEPLPDQVLQGMDHLVFPETMNGEMPLVPPVETVQIPLCQTEGFINWTCHAQGQRLHDLTVGKWGSVSNGILVGMLDNQGWVSNLTIESSGILKGGIVTGYILNQGTLIDITFVGALLQGGTLSGTILNESQAGGTLLDVTFAPHAHLTGGKLQGQIRGDQKAPTLLENVKVLKGSTLSGVELGPGVLLEEEVKIDQ